MASDQQEIQLVLEAISKGLGDISKLAGELERTGASADETQERLSKFDASVQSAKEGITTLKDSLGNLAAAFLSVGTVQYIADQIKAVAVTKQFADSIGLSTESLSSYQAILKKFGVEVEDTNDALGSVTEKIYEAAEAGSDASELFSALGVSVTDSAGAIKSTDQVIAELANGMRDSQNATTNTAVALGLFGDVGLKLLPILTQGSERIQELTAAAKENGEVLTNEQAVSAEKAAAALAQMSADLSKVGREIAITFAPAVEYGTALTRDLIDVTDFLGKSLGNLFYSIINLDFSSYQERQKELFTELTENISKNHAEIGKAASALEDVGKKATVSAKQTEEFGWNMVIAGRAAADLSGTLDEILGKPIDSNSAVQLGMALETAGKQAGNTASIIENDLNASISNLSNDQLKKLQESSESAFNAGKLGAEQYDTILKAISTGALTQLGVDTEKLSSGFTSAEKDALDLFQTVMDSAQSSSAALQAGLLQTLQQIKTPIGLEELQNRFETLKESGRLTSEELAGLSPIFSEIDSAITAGLQPGAEFDALLNRLKDTAIATASGVSVLEQAFKTLGIEAPATLKDTADAAESAFSAIASGDTILATQQQAFLVYADAALKAADAAGKPAPKLLEQQAAALGLSQTYIELQRSIESVNPEFDAIIAAMDRQTVATTAHQATLIAEIDAQANVTDALIAASIARGQDAEAASAAVVAGQARIDAANQEAVAQQEAAAAAQAKLEALDAEIIASGKASTAQLEQIVVLREEVAQKKIAAEASQERAVAIKAEEEANGRLTASLDASLRAVQTQYQPQLDLTSAKVEAAKAALQVAEASGDEIRTTEALVELKKLEAEQARLNAELKLAEADAARAAAAAVQTQALADGLFTEAEQTATKAAEAAVQAKEAGAEAARILAEETEKAADAAQKQATTTDAAARAVKEWTGDLKGVQVAFAAIDELAASAFGTEGIKEFQTVVNTINSTLSRVDPLLLQIKDSLKGSTDAANRLSLTSALREAENLAKSLDTVKGDMEETARTAAVDLRNGIADAKKEMAEFAKSQKEALNDRLKALEDYRAEGDDLRIEELRHTREITDLEKTLAVARQQNNSDAIKAIQAQIDAENILHKLKLDALKEEQKEQQKITDAASDKQASVAIKENTANLADLSKTLKPANDELRTMLTLLVQIEQQSGKTAAAAKKYFDELIRQLNEDSLAR